MSRWRSPLAKRFAVGLALVSVAILLVYSALREPTDSSLARTFTTHRQTFVELKEMMETEAELYSVGSDNVGNFWLQGDGWRDAEHPDKGHCSEAQMLATNNLSAERYGKYLANLKKVGAYRVTKGRGVRHYGQIGIEIYRSGLVTGGMSKGIVHSNTSVSPLVEDTDDLGMGIFYRKLDSDWYIEVNRN